MNRSHTGHTKKLSIHGAQLFCKLRNKGEKLQYCTVSQNFKSNKYAQLCKEKYSKGTSREKPWWLNQKVDRVVANT